MVNRNVRNAKFMGNILVPPSNRTQYIKALEPITADAEVSFNRAVVALVVLAITWIVAIKLFLDTGEMVNYIGVPIFVIAMSLTVLTVFYALPSRGKSVLEEVIRLMGFYFYEKVRIKASKKNTISTLGIKHITRKGVLEFDNGDYGVLYFVEGQMSLSTLPAVATAVSDARRAHLISRSSTSTEMMITSISDLDLSSQKKYLENVGNVGDGWDGYRKYLSALNNVYIKENVSDTSKSTKQYILLRDIDKHQLTRTVKNFTNSVGRGILASAVLLNNKDSVVSALGGIVLCHKKVER